MSDTAPARKRRPRRWKRRLFFVVLHLIGFGMSIDAVMTNRTAQGAIAWGVALNTFPVATVPLYAVFARHEFQGYAEAFQDRREELEGLRRTAHEALAPVRIDEAESIDRIANYEALKQIAGLRFLRGNRVDLLIDGEATFESIFAGIDRAERYVLVLFYIVKDDRLGRRLQTAMIDAAGRGVRVAFLYDELGSRTLPESYLAALTAAGVETSRFNSTQGWRNRFQLNFRNHRKIVVVDGREAWVGGHNVGDEYLGRDPGIGPWRDTHVRVVGPAALHAQAIFLADWYWATRRPIAVDWTPHVAEDGDVSAMILELSPVRLLDEGRRSSQITERAQLFFVHALNAARQRIWLATPYFVPDEAIMTALRLAALRGVDVRIIVPDQSDNPVVDMATLWYLERLDGVDIQFYRYTEGFMHQKVFLVDDTIATVGSANFDNRSFRLQFEVNAVINDRAFAEQMEAMLLEDFERSQRFDSADVRRASFAKRLAVSVARLTAPLL